MDYKMKKSEEHKKAVQIEEILNCMCLDEELIGRCLAEGAHPTIQQGFMRLVKGFVEAEAEKPFFDDRNEATVKLAKELNEVSSLHNGLPLI